MLLSEEQSFQQKTLLISIVVSDLIIFTLLSLALRSQRELNNLFDNNQFSKKILILANALIFLVFKWIFSSNRYCCLFSRVNSKGKSIRFNPFHNKHSYHNNYETGRYEITKYDPIGDYGSQGNCFKKKATLI